MTSNDQKKQSNGSAGVRAEARGAVAKGEDIRDTVRDLVIRVLSRQPLTRDSIEAVSTAVLEGAAAGAPESNLETARAFAEATEGVDAALARAVQASQLAIEEAAGRADEFTAKDLTQAARDLGDIENLLQDVVTALAKGGSAASREIATDLARHLERTGTDTARAVQQALHTGQAAAASAHLPRPADVSLGARTGLATLAAIGSGILAGLSEGLAPDREAPSAVEPKDEEKT
jgi:uncharacterized membrane protein YccC